MYIYIYVCVFTYSYIDRFFCVCAYVCTYVYVGACVCICVYVFQYLHILAYRWVHVYKCVSVSVCMWIYVYGCVWINSASMHICVDACMRIYVFMCMSVYVYIWWTSQMRFPKITKKKAQRPPRAVELSFFVIFGKRICRGIRIWIWMDMDKYGWKFMDLDGQDGYGWICMEYTKIWLDRDG